MPTTGPDQSLRVLVVCTANICRSPMAEQFLKRAFAMQSVAAEVSSAGFLFDGRSASETTQKVMAGRGFDLSAHRSRIINAQILADVDVVLTMERRHGRDLVLEHDVAEKVHTFKSFADALYADSLAVGPGDVAALLQALARGRSEHALLGDGCPDEVADPHGRSARVHRKAADELRATADALAAGWSKIFQGARK